MDSPYSQTNYLISMIHKYNILNPKKYYHEIFYYEYLIDDDMVHCSYDFSLEYPWDGFIKHKTTIDDDRSGGSTIMPMAERLIGREFVRMYSVHHQSQLSNALAQS